MALIITIDRMLLLLSEIRLLNARYITPKSVSYYYLVFLCNYQLFEEFRRHMATASNGEFDWKREQHYVMCPASFRRSQTFSSLRRQSPLNDFIVRL